MKKLTITFAILVFVTRILAQGLSEEALPKGTILSPKALTEDFEQLNNLLKTYHSGLFWYMDRFTWDNEVKSIKNQLTEPMGEMDFYRLVNPLIAKIACGHTAIRPSHSFYIDYNQNGTMFPVQVKFLEGKAYVQQDFSKTPGLEKGLEITAIDGKPIEEVLTLIMPHITADGNIKSAKFNELEYWFPLFYTRFVQNTDTHILTLTKNGKEANIPVDAVKPAVVKPTISQQEPISFSFSKVKGNAKPVRTLDINTFSQWDIEAAKIDYDKFLKQIFTTLKKEKAQELIIDLRGNNGGNDDFGAKLFAYLSQEPFAYYSSVEVNPETKYAIPLARRMSYKFKEIDGKILYTNHPALGKLQPENLAFEGDVYVLIDGGTFSAAAGFAAIASDQGRAILIGEETGGAKLGNTSGVILDAVLPNTGLRLSLPTFRYSLALQNPSNKGVGVIPDHKITPTVEQWLANEDAQMEYVFSLIGQVKLAQASR
ncbi:S41 family peptidase [Flammeovirgaceae bacterium SG7u.111]|nr:S41 family peptidase [Flammeovirgaceae bacterium SG7u.132]WPO34687.1 S41 family peptidase [Flammeovirgaceae bacterium SG7u.111]